MKGFPYDDRSTIEKIPAALAKIRKLMRTDLGSEDIPGQEELIREDNPNPPIFYKVPPSIFVPQEVIDKLRATESALAKENSPPSTTTP
jgi:hypothetical protein